MKIIRGIYTIDISESVLSLMSNYKQVKKNMPEAGGILLARIKDNNVYIIRNTIPNKFDKASRYNFERDKESAQIIIDHEFFNSNKKTIYIGEWHTHPESVPTPSNQDIKMLKEQYHKNKINEKFLILLIQGIEELYIGLYDGKNILEK